MTSAAAVLASDNENNALLSTLEEEIMVGCWIKPSTPLVTNRLEQMIPLIQAAKVASTLAARNIVCYLDRDYQVNIQVSNLASVPTTPLALYMA